jgi:hypothetical protein
VKAQIQIFAYGEQEAMDVGQPDGADDRDFRSVNVDVLSGQQHEVQKQTNIFLSTEADFTQINTDPDGNLNQALHKDLPEFEKSSVDGYSYRFDDVVARETGNQLLRAEVEVMSGLQAQPSMFFPFNVVGRNGEQGIIRDGVYDLMNKPGQDAFLPPGSWPVRVIEVTPTSFTFETLQGHFDPAGSRITFSTWTDQKGDVHLEHHGVADSKNNPNVIYLFAPNMADAAWQRQSANLRAWMNMGGLRTAAGRAWLSSQKR